MNSKRAAIYDIGKVYKEKEKKKTRKENKKKQEKRKTEKTSQNRKREEKRKKGGTQNRDSLRFVTATAVTGHP